MQNKKTVYLIVGLVAIALVVCFMFFPNQKAFAPAPVDSQNSTGGITYKNASSDVIVVDLPYVNGIVLKDFSAMGKARGQWFFEASFPVEVLDNQGKSLASGIAQAQGDWMTTEFVLFKADIKIPESYTGPAIIVLKKDNPSGTPENDASVSFPITIRD